VKVLRWASPSTTRDNLADALSQYWSIYASFQPDDFLKTVKELNPDFASQMNMADFFIVDIRTGATVYNPNNYWNAWTKTGSIIHLCQPNNTLSAEIDIAAQATVLREDQDGNPITDPDQLINCSQYGNPGRHSDPTVSSIRQLPHLKC
jgi:hypothetical protein